MNRNLERKTMLIGGIWQVVSGIITIFIYSTSIKVGGVAQAAASNIDLDTSKLFIDSAYMVSVSLGLAYLIMGILNIVLSRSFKITNVEIKKPIITIVCGIVSYLLMDFISCFIYVVSGIIALSKNKAIKLIVTT